MAKIQVEVENLFNVFKASIGSEPAFKLACNQTAAMLGQLKVETTEGDWKVSAKGILSQGTKNKAALAMNNPAAIMFATALELESVRKTRLTIITASVPEKCTAWIHELKNKPAKPEEQVQKA